MASLAGNNPVQHPLQATASAIGAAGGDPRTNRASFFQGANEGPAEIAAKISGVNLGGKREDDSAYFTNNEGLIPGPDTQAYLLTQKTGIPWPDPLVATALDCSSLIPQ